MQISIDEFACLLFFSPICLSGVFRRSDDGRTLGGMNKQRTLKKKKLLRNDQIGTAGRLNPKDLIRSLRELDNKWCGHGAEWMFVGSFDKRREREREKEGNGCVCVG